MKKIEAIIKPFKLDTVKDALGEVGIMGITVSEVRDFEQPGARSGVFRGQQYTVDFLPKIKIEVVLADDQLESTVTAIVKAAKTARMGDGNIFISSVEEVVRIRTAEKREVAL